MALVKQTMSSLVNGVSQQPDPVRLESQAAEQINGLSDVTDGVTTRPASTLINDFTPVPTDPLNGRLKMVPITADDGEDYIAVFNGIDGATSGIQVFNSDGVAQQVNIQLYEGTLDGSSEYLDLDPTTGNPRRDLAVTTVGNSLFIANREKEVAMDTAVTPEISNSALVWIRQAVPGQKYEISLTDYEIPYDPGAAGQYLLNDGNAAELFVDNNMAGLGQLQNQDPNGEYTDVGDEAEIKVKAFCKFTTPATNPGAGTIDPFQTLINLLGHADSATSLGGGSVLNPGLQPGDSIDDDPDVLFNDTAVTFAAAFHPDYIGPGAWQGAPLGNQPVGMLSVRESLEGTIPSATENLRFVDTTDGTAMSVAHRQVASLDLLPYTGAPVGFRIKVDGDTGAPEDDFYVEYDGESWRECPGPGIEYKFDIKTMPHVLERQPDGVWVFGPGDWADRAAGDLLSLPAPSFVGSKIRSIAVHKNRLVFATPTTFIFSETGKLKNFWGTTARDVLDTDPIDVEVSNAGSERAANTEFLLGMDQVLIGFGQRAQVVLEGSGVERSFTPATVGAESASFYDISGLVPPVLVGPRAYYVSQPGSDFASIHEFGAMEGSAYLSGELTTHVPKYIPGDIDLFAGSSDSNMLLCGSTSDRTKLYVYRQYYAGDQKLQSSWSTWQFEGEILDAIFRGDSIYIAMETQTTHDVYGSAGTQTLERIDLNSSNTEGYEDILKFSPRIDHRQDYFYDPIDFNATVDEEKGGTWIIIPERMSQDNGVVMTIANNYISVEKRPERDPQDNRYIFLRGYPTVGDTLVFGSLIEFDYKLSKLYLQEPGESNETGGRVAVTTGRLQLKSIQAALKESGAVTVEISPQGRPLFEREYTPKQPDGYVLGTPALTDYDYFKFDVGCNAQSTDIEFKVEEVTPTTLTSIEWVANYYEKKTGRG